jgi:cellulose biosynthesis protein BcsQ
MIPTTLSSRTLRQLLDFLAGDARLRERRVMPFFTMVDRRKRLHLDLMERLPEEFPNILDACIPYASEVERMGVFRMPLPAYAPAHPAARAYRTLWGEVKQAL